MDFDIFRQRLTELEELGADMLKQIAGIPFLKEDIASCTALLQQFVSQMEGITARIEKEVSRRDQIQRPLVDFLNLTSTRFDAEQLLSEHMRKVSDWLSTWLMDIDELEQQAAPYLLFIRLVREPTADISEEEGDLLDAVFGNKATRPLYQGKFAIEQPKTMTWPPEMFEDPQPESVPEPLPELVPEPDAEPDLFVIKTEKENSVLSTKAFHSDYRKPAQVPCLPLLCFLGHSGALTEQQIEIYYDSTGNEVASKHLDRLYKDGFLSSIRHAPSDTQFFTLSKKGNELFLKQTSRDLIKRVWGQWLPSKVWNCTNILPLMQRDVLSYKTLTTAMLCIFRIAFRQEEAVSKITFERHEIDPANPYILFVMRYHSGVGPMHEAVAVLLPTEQGLCFSIAQKNSNTENEDILIRSLLLGDTFARYTCLLSEEDTSISFLDATGEALSLNSLFARELDYPLEDTPWEVPEASITPVPVDNMDANLSFETIPPPPKEEAPIPKSTPQAPKKPVAKKETVVPSPPVIPMEEPPRVEMALSRQEAISQLQTNPAQLKREDAELLLSLLLEDATQHHEPNMDCMGRALVLLKTLSMEDASLYQEDYLRLLLATDSPLDEKVYTGEELLTHFGEAHEGTALHLAAVLRALFRPHIPTDHLLFGQADNMRKEFDRIFPRFCVLKPLLNTMLEIKKQDFPGFTSKTILRYTGAHEREELLQKLSQQAAQWKNPPYIKAHFNGLPEMLKKCFAPDSVLGMCMEWIATAQMDSYAEIQETFDSFSDQGELSLKRLGDVCDQYWKEVRTENQTKGKIQTEILYQTRDKILAGLKERVLLLKEWLAVAAVGKETAQPKVRALFKKVRTALQESIPAVMAAEDIRPADRTIFLHMLSHLSTLLDGAQPLAFQPEDWLSSGIFPFKDGMPWIDPAFVGVRFYEPWRNALRHMETAPEELRTVLQRIETPDDSLYDNYGQAIAICQFLQDPDAAKMYRESIPHAEKEAEGMLEKFRQTVVMEYARGGVEETVKESITEALETLGQSFWESADFAQFRQLLKALRKTLTEQVEQRRKIWLEAIAERRKHGNYPSLARAEAFLNSENANFVQVEDFLASFDSSDGQADFNPELTTSEQENLFAAFLSEKTFKELSELCRKKREYAFKKFAPTYVETKTTQAGLSQQYRTDAIEFSKCLPNRPEEGTPEVMGKLLERMGFLVSEVKRQDSPNTVLHVIATMKAERKNLPHYPHPIADMGTRIPVEMHVIELFGSVEPESILAEIRKLNPRTMPLVFVNGSLTLQQRRQLARLYLKGGAANPFLLIDWVLLLHLALTLREDRIKTLLACAMPFTGTKQLFSKVSTQSIADEMYIGRDEEMKNILDMKGPVIVYGGRQLGKTALLRRAKNLFHDPEAYQYSVFVDIKECGDEASFLALLTEALTDANIKIPQANTLFDLYKSLRDWLVQDSKRKFLMLLDESDKLLSEFAQIDYAPLNHLERLCQEADGRFKFVFAGLHNVFLAGNQPNSIFGHFGIPLCIKPMSQADAYKLLARPLSYLGFSVKPDILLRHLISTNFYPGIVHLMGAELIDMLLREYQDYEEAKSPPYELTEDVFGVILHSSKLNEAIRERIHMTLRVDPAYLAISRCIALLYCLDSQERKHGFSKESILKLAKDFAVAELVELSVETCGHLLSELCDMSILVETDHRYRFRQSRFWDIIGKNEDELLEQLSSPEVM